MCCRGGCRETADPEPAEIAMMLPFLRRHVELVQPDILVLMGNTPASLLNQRGILADAAPGPGFGLPALR